MKIDYEITVDVSNADIETKKRVQDAFFKLGFTWWDGDKYACLGKDCYTNTKRSGQVTQDLMWSASLRNPTHTIDQLFELAGMKTETKLIPFNLEKALAGETVVTRDGREVSQVTLFECESRYPLRAVVDGEICSFTQTGQNYDNGQPSRHDLFMKPKTRIINGFEVPAPAMESLKPSEVYFVPALYDDTFYYQWSWADEPADSILLKRGLVFLTKEDAAATAKAMLGINPYGDDDEQV